MDRFEVINVYRAMLRQEDIESIEIDKLIDESKSNCSKGVCGIGWKPVLAKSDISEEKE